MRKRGVQQMDDIVVCDLSPERLKFISDTYHVKTTHSIDDAVKSADLILLAVKPQNVETVAASIHHPISGVLLSIVAGCTIEKLSKEFRTSKVIRSMPNTPGKILYMIPYIYIDIMLYTIYMSWLY